MKNIIIITLLIILITCICFLKKRENFSLYGIIANDSCLECNNIKNVINKINSIEEKIKTFKMPPKSRDCVGYWNKRDCNITDKTDIFGDCPRKLTTAEFITINNQSGDGRKCPNNIFRNDYPCKVGRKCNIFMIQNTIDNKYLFVGRNSSQTKWINIDNIKKNNKFKIGSVFILEKLPMNDNTFKIRLVNDPDDKYRYGGYWYMDGYGSLSGRAVKSTGSNIIIEKINNLFSITCNGRQLLTDKNNSYYRGLSNGSWGYPNVYFKSPNSVNFKINNKIRLIPYYGNELFS